MNVWKIGSRLGNAGESVLGLFLDYGCVFFGSCNEGQRLGDWQSVKPGDFFAICEGKTVVALGKSLGRFPKDPDPDTQQDSEYRGPGFYFTQQDKEYIDIEDDNVKICPAKIVLLPYECRIGNAPQLRFCEYKDAESRKRLQGCWKNLSQPGSFKIIPRAVSLFSGSDCIWASNVKYRIPIYQRPYSWGESELRKLLETLRDAVQTNEPVFMGTMQLSQPIPLDSQWNKKAYNIIDGQQRITTFMILMDILKSHLGKPVTSLIENKLRTWVSRGEEQKKLDEYIAFINKKESWNGSERNTYIRNYHIIDGLLAEYFGQEQADAEEENPTEEGLYKFINSDKIQFVVIETHAGLSKTLQIFNTINTAGLDLNATDLFKIRFFEYLKTNGAPDTIFDQIAEIYARIEEYNRIHPEYPAKLSMQDVLRTYQRIISARDNLRQSAFEKSTETFFEELFDTLLGNPPPEEFKNVKISLSIDDLKNIIRYYEENYELLANDWDFHIIRDMIWETRYGYVWDMPIVARFFGCIDRAQIFEFTLCLFKLLCPPSLYYAKIINQVRSVLIDVLKEMSDCQSQGNGVDILKGNLGRLNLQEMFQKACEFEIAGNPKWKNLICRLVEYLKSQEKDQKLYDRLWSSIDIEHIQCYTDENDAEQVRREWGAELNCMGNLVLLESGINRSIKNRRKEKNKAYCESSFESVKELRDSVANWSKEDAETRRAANTELIERFIFGEHQA